MPNERWDRGCFCLKMTSHESVHTRLTADSSVCYTQLRRRLAEPHGQHCWHCTGDRLKKCCLSYGDGSAVLLTDMSKTASHRPELRLRGFWACGTNTCRFIRSTRTSLNMAIYGPLITFSIYLLKVPGCFLTARSSFSGNDFAFQKLQGRLSLSLSVSLSLSLSVSLSLSLSLCLSLSLSLSLLVCLAKQTQSRQYLYLIADHLLHIKKPIQELRQMKPDAIWSFNWH